MKYKTIENFFLYGIVLSAPLHLYRFYFYIGDLSFSRIFLILYLILFFRRNTNNAFKFFNNKNKSIIYAIIVFLVVYFFNCLLIGGPISTNSLVNIILFFLFSFVIVININNFERHEKVLYIFVISTIIPLFFGFFQFFNYVLSGTIIKLPFFDFLSKYMSPERDVGDALRIYSNSGDGIRFASMFSDANFWGYFQLYITLIGFYVYKFTKKNIFGVLTLLSILGILISASRSALIGLIIAIFIFLIYIKQLKRYLIYFLISLILLSVINTISLENNVATSLSRFSNETSVGDEGVRIALMLNGINKFIHNPLFGAGIGNLIVKGRIDMVSSAHNIYLSILGEMGLFGFIPFIIFIYLIAISLIRIIRRSKSIKIKYLSSIYLSLLVAIVFINLLYDFLWALECNAVLLGLMINFIYLNLSKYKKTHYIENQTNKSENRV